MTAGRFEHLNGGCEAITKILLAGSSFTDPNYGAYPPNSQPDFLWSREIATQWGAKNIASAGYGNFNIWHSVRQKTWDVLIVNLASIRRIADVSPDPRPGVDRWGIAQSQIEQVERQNRQWAQKISSLPNAYVWTAFPDYKAITGVDYLQVEGHEIRESSVRDVLFSSCGNHFNYPGNLWMIDHINLQIETILNRSNNVKTTS